MGATNAARSLKALAAAALAACAIALCAAMPGQAWADTYVAKIGDNGYPTLQAAVDAAASGDTVEIVAAGTYDMPKFKDKELTFKGDGSADIVLKDYLTQGSQDLSGSTVHFVNLAIEGATTNYRGLYHTAKVTYDNCNIKGLRFLYADEVEFNGCDFDSNGQEHSFWTYGAKSVKVTGCSFTYADRAVNCYSDSGKFTTNVSFVNTTFTYAGSKADPEGAVEVNSGDNDGKPDVDSTNDINLEFSGCTAPAKGKMWFISQWDAEKGAFTTVKENDADAWPVYVAQIGDKKYTSLKDAVKAANASHGTVTVALIGDAEVGEAIDVTGNVTIDGAGHVITWANGYADTLLNVESGASLATKNLVIDGENAFTFYNDTAAVENGESWYKRFVNIGDEDKSVNADVITSAGNLTLGKGTVIQNVTVTSDGSDGKTENTETGYILKYNDNLALIASAGGKVIVDGAVIAGNAGLALKASGSETVIIGSKIDGNMGCGRNGGIILADGGSMDITDTSISENKAMARSATILGVINGAEVTFGDGAAMERNKHIGVGDNTAGAMVVLEGASKFVMEGGSISDNIGGRAGAIASRWVGGSYGIHQETSIQLKAGTIAGNTASHESWGGASVFLRSPASIEEGMAIEGLVAVNTSPGELSITGGSHMGGLEVADGLKASITGGIFGYDPAPYVAQGYESVAVEGADNLWVVGEEDAEYKVTFASNGGSGVDPQTVALGECFVKPADPTREGFAFAGWFTDMACTAAYDFAIPATGDIALYAKWTESPSQPGGSDGDGSEGDQPAGGIDGDDEGKDDSKPESKDTLAKTGDATGVAVAGAGIALIVAGAIALVARRRAA